MLLESAPVDNIFFRETINELFKFPLFLYNFGLITALIYLILRILFHPRNKRKQKEIVMIISNAPHPLDVINCLKWIDPDYAKKIQKYLPENFHEIK